MAIDVNSAKYTATKLIKKVSPFASPHVDSLKVVNQKFYEQIISPRTLKIETHKLESPLCVHAEFSSRTSSQNGTKFEIYKLPEETIKVLKNRYGEIIKFKSSMDCHNFSPEWTYKNVKEAMAEKLRAFLKWEHSYN